MGQGAGAAGAAGAGAAGAGAAGAGAVRAPASAAVRAGVVVVVAGRRERASESRPEVLRYASDADVSMNNIAQTLVAWARNPLAPRPPKTVCVAAPESTPMPPDRPDCKSTTPTRNKQTNT